MAEDIDLNQIGSSLAQPDFDLNQIGASVAGTSPEEHKLHAARFRAKEDLPEDTAGDYIARNLGHFTSTLVGHTLSTRARNRIAEGRAEDNDYDIVARHERLKELAGQSESGFWGGLGATALRAPEQVAMQMLLPGPPGGAGIGARMAVGGITTPFNPSMWVPEAIERAERQGGNFLAPQNALPAMGAAGIQNAIFGGAGGVGEGIKNPVRAWANRAGAGLLAQQGGDAMVSALDAVLPEAYKTETKFGALGSFLRGDLGEGMKQLASQAIQHGAFAMLHHGDKKKAVDAVKDAVNEQMEMLRKAPPEDQAAVEKPGQSGVTQVAGQPVMETGVPGREQTGVPGYTLKEVAPKEAIWHDTYEKELRGGASHEAAQRAADKVGKQTWQHSGTKFEETPDHTEFTTSDGKKYVMAMSVDAGRRNMQMYAIDPTTGEHFGHVLFDKKEGNGKDFSAADITMNDKLKGDESKQHRRDIVNAMYDFAHEITGEMKSTGHEMAGDIVRSETTSKGGKAVWERNAKEALARRKEAKLRLEKESAGAKADVEREPNTGKPATGAGEPAAEGTEGVPVTGADEAQAGGAAAPGAPGAGEGGGPGAVPQGKPAIGIRPTEDARNSYDLTTNGKKRGEMSLGDAYKRKGAGGPGEAGMAENQFPGVTKEGETVARINSIELDKDAQGQGLGQQLYLRALKEHGADWYYNSQTYPGATNALKALEAKGLIEAHWDKVPGWGEKGGIHLIRLTDKGREAVQKQPAELTGPELPAGPRLPPEVEENIRNGLTPEEAERVHDVDARKSGGATLAERMKAKGRAEKEGARIVVPKHLQGREPSEVPPVPQSFRDKLTDLGVLKRSSEGLPVQLTKKDEALFKQWTKEEVAAEERDPNAWWKKKKDAAGQGGPTDWWRGPEPTPEQLAKAETEVQQYLKDIPNDIEEHVNDKSSGRSKASLRREAEKHVLEGFSAGAAYADERASRQAPEGGAETAPAPAVPGAAGNELTRVAPDQANVSIYGYKAKPETMEAIHRLIGGREIKYGQLLAEAVKAEILLPGKMSNARHILTSALTQLDFEGKIQTFGPAADRGLGETIRPAPVAAGNELGSESSVVNHLKRLFSNVEAEDEGVYNATSGDLKLSVGYLPKDNVTGLGPAVNLDFTSKGRSTQAEIPKQQPRAAAIGFARKLKELVKGLGQEGVGVTFDAEDSRSETYRNILKDLGFRRNERYNTEAGEGGRIFTSDEAWSPPEAERFLKGPPGQKLPDIGSNYVRPLADFSDRVFREVSVEEADRYLPNSTGSARNPFGEKLYFANTPDLALGQGKNKGVLFEFDTQGINGRVNTSKPGASLAYQSGQAELTTEHHQPEDLRGNVKSVTVTPEASKQKGPYLARLKRFLGGLEQDGWKKEEQPDGSAKYTKPEASERFLHGPPEGLDQAKLKKYVDKVSDRWEGYKAEFGENLKDFQDILERDVPNEKYHDAVKQAVLGGAGGPLAQLKKDPRFAGMHPDKLQTIIEEMSPEEAIKKGPEEALKAANDIKLGWHMGAFEEGGERFLFGPGGKAGKPVDEAAHDQYRKALAGSGNQPVGTIRGLLEGNKSTAARELIKKAGDVPVFVSDGLPADVPARHILTQDGQSFIALNRQRPLTAKELAWALGHEGAHAARARTGRGVAYEPGKPEEEHAFEESANRLAEAVSGRKAGERSLAGPPAGAAPAAANQPSGKPVSQFDIIATMKAKFGMPTYGGAEEASYDLHNESTTVPKSRAGDAPLISHELAHHLETQLKLLPALTANNLPPDVKAGLAQLDYIPNRPNPLVGAREGFAEWVRRYLTGNLKNLNPQEQAASDYLFNLMAQKGVARDLGDIKEMFDRYNAQSHKEKYGGLISETGKPAEPELKPGEMAAGYAKRSLDSAVDKLVDDAMPAKRAEKAAEARGAKFAPGTKLSEVIATGRLRTAPLAIEFQQGGVHGFDQGGKQKQLGRPLAKILEGLSGEDLKDLDRFGAARRDVFDADVSKLPIPAADLQLARDTLRELGQDPQRLQRLSDVADAVRKEVYNASLDSMVMSGFMTQEKADGIKDGNPFYWPAYKIPEHEWFSPTPNFFKARKGGSGEQRVNMMDALQDRYQFLANVLNKQAKFGALLELSKKPGVGEWLSPGQPGEEPDPKLGGVVGWPKDGSRPTISGKVNGENINIRVNDKAFYEMATGTQGEGDAMHGFLKGLGDVMQKTYAPQTIRVGATALAPAWLTKSFVRDLFLYPQRTISEKGVIRDIGDYLAWSAKGLEFYGRALLSGGAENVALKHQSDIYFKLMERMSGREHGASGEKVLDGWPGFFHRLTDFFTSTEKATRVLELKNAWDKLGWTRDRINAELAKDPSQRNPVPFAEQVAGLDIASQITHNVHQQGTWVRELNRSTPFLGAHIAGVYKDLQSFARNPKKVAGTLAILMAAKGLEYSMNKDDEEWNSLPDHYRYGFSFKTPFGWMHIPAPRGISGVITGMMDYATRKMGDNNPNLAGFAKQAFGELAPSPVSAPIKLYGDIRSNTDTFGRPIVPHREEGTPAGYLKQGRYIAGQATGGLTERPLKLGQAAFSGEVGKVGETLNPFSMHVVPKDVRDVRQFRQTYRDILDRYKGEWWDATQKGMKFKQPPELKIAEEMSGKLHKLDLAANQPSATPEQVQRYRADQAKIARSALEKIEAYQKAKR